MNGYNVAIEIINNKIAYLQRCLDFYASMTEKDSHWESRIDRTLEAVYYLTETRKEIARLEAEGQK